MNKAQINVALIATLALSLIVVAAVVPNYPAPFNAQLRSFSSYEELRDFIVASSNYQNNYGYPELMGGSLINRFSLSDTSAASVLPEYSTTNVQVEGVDEADIVKTDGTYIYVISNQSIIILQAYPAENAEILSRINFNGTLRGVFINGDKLAAFEDTGYYYYYTGDSRITIAPYYQYTEETSIRVYDITDRANPVSTRNVTVDGSYFTSRMIGDYAYAIVNEPIYVKDNEVNLPRINYTDHTEEIPATEIYYSNTTDNFNTYSQIISVNLVNDKQDPTIKPILTGYASTVYVSQDNIYITYSTYQEQEQTTGIHRIRIDRGDITYEASGQVSGYALNQFSMDEYNGYFRIATTTGEVWARGETASQNHVYILDMKLNTVGKLEDLAPGEKIYSARFMGNRGYLVTFKKIDPLFVLDLTEPTNPRVLGELKITGYSDYLHPYDETHVIGIGKETIEGEGGNFAWYQGVKMSLFDVSNVENPKEIGKYEIGDRGTDSPVLTDHKAFLFDKAKNLLVIPVRVAEIDPSKYPGEIPPYAYGDIVWDGAYVFHISLEEGLVLQGRISHMSSGSELTKPGYYYDGSQYSIKRSLYIGNVLYTVSNSKIMMNSIDDLSQINQIVLNP